MLVAGVAALAASVALGAPFGAWVVNDVVDHYPMADKGAEAVVRREAAREEAVRFSEVFAVVLVP